MAQDVEHKFRWAVQIAAPDGAWVDIALFAAKPDAEDYAEYLEWGNGEEARVEQR